jgi:hypothetical protein
MPTNSETPVLPEGRLFTGWLLGGLLIFLAGHALLAGWALGPPGSRDAPFTRSLTPETLARAQTGWCTAAALLLAPLWTLNTRTSAWAWARIAFASFWLGATTFFFLLLSARLAAAPQPVLAQVALLVACVGWLAGLWAWKAPDSYPALLAVVGAALPMALYFSAETFYLTPAGATGWKQAGEAYQGYTGWLEFLLKSSPVTAPMAALDQQAPGGAAFGWRQTAFAAGLFLAAGLAAHAGSMVAWGWPGRREIQPEAQELA